jgi:hypothetical protein
LIFGESLITICALVDFIRYPVIDKVIGKIDAVEPQGKIINTFEILAFTGIAQEIFMDGFHLQLLWKNWDIKILRRFLPSLCFFFNAFLV